MLTISPLQHFIRAATMPNLGPHDLTQINQPPANLFVRLHWALLLTVTPPMQPDVAPCPLEG
jgi:hypothetical protein